MGTAGLLGAILLLVALKLPIAWTAKGTSPQASIPPSTPIVSTGDEGRRQAEEEARLRAEAEEKARLQQERAQEARRLREEKERLAREQAEKQAKILDEAIKQLRGKGPVILRIAHPTSASFRGLEFKKKGAGPGGGMRLIFDMEYEANIPFVGPTVCYLEMNVDFTPDGEFENMEWGRDTNPVPPGLVSGAAAALIDDILKGQ